MPQSSDNKGFIGAMRLGFTHWRLRRVGKLIRVTLDPEQKIIISAGRERLPDVLKRIDFGAFKELDPLF